MFTSPIRSERLGRFVAREPDVERVELEDLLVARIEVDDAGRVAVAKRDAAFVR